VKEEDADWLIYHLIVQVPSITLEKLVPVSGFASSDVDASLKRLERKLLIERNGEMIKVLSVSESLIRNQVKYCTDLPYTIENGVIRMRKK
jgi:hypothetical protein